MPTQRLHQVVAGALDLIEEQRIRTEEQERRRLARQKAKDRHDRQVELRKQELNQLEKLKASATQWLEVERLRQYIEAVEQAAVRNGELSKELRDWISWERIKANCIDPLIPVSDAIFGWSGAKVCRVTITDIGGITDETLRYSLSLGQIELLTGSKV